MVFHAVPSEENSASTTSSKEEISRIENDAKKSDNVQLLSDGSPVRYNSATPTLETVPEVQVTSDGNDTLSAGDIPSSSKNFQKKIPKKVSIVFLMFTHKKSFLE